VIAQSTWLTDNSHLARLGLKGPLAAAWLQERGFAIPDLANSWTAPASDEQDIVVRLGTTEFFLEQAMNGEKLRALTIELFKPVPGVYPVLREDRAFVLGGVGADEVLAQMCNVNFSALRHEREAVMTMMIGVAVIVAPQGNAARRRYRIWCDPSYGDYLLSSLQDVTGTKQPAKVTPFAGGNEATV
jgi:sarcosine oxidase, subunit gamma